METPFPMPKPNEPGFPLEIVKGDPILLPPEVFRWLVVTQESWVKETQERKLREQIEAQERKAQTEALNRVSEEIAGLEKTLVAVEKAFNDHVSQDAIKDRIEKVIEDTKRETRAEIMAQIEMSGTHAVDPQKRQEAERKPNWSAVAFQVIDNKFLLGCITLIIIVLGSMAIFALQGQGLIQAIQHWGGK
jgi:hypothetical protein